MDLWWVLDSEVLFTVWSLGSSDIGIRLSLRLYKPSTCRHIDICHPTPSTKTERPLRSGSIVLGLVKSFSDGNVNLLPSAERVEDLSGFSAAVWDSAMPQEFGRGH